MIGSDKRLGVLH